ncbi:MAG: hypothetical protein ACOH2P_06060 [Pseudomonas sp.]
MGRPFAFHCDLADPRIKLLSTNAATDEHGHQAETGCANCNVHIKSSFAEGDVDPGEQRELWPAISPVLEPPFG